MKPSLKAGLEAVHQFRVGDDKLVPALYPEAREFREMPGVFATGFMVGFLEWTCLKVIEDHLDYPREQTVGTHINVSHAAATPPGMTVIARAKLVEVDGRRLVFEVVARDERDEIGRGTHERFVIERARFDDRVAAKVRGDAG